jgi:hypothetical protein
MNLAELKAVALAANMQEWQRPRVYEALADMVSFRLAFNPEVALKLITAVEAARPAMEAMKLCERNIVLIGNACNDAHVSEAVMDRALIAQVQCIDACRSALSGLRVALEAVDLGSVHLTQPVGVCTAPGDAPRSTLDLMLTKDDAEYIAAFITDEDEPGDDVVRLLVGDGNKGYGMYATHPDYPEEGAILIKNIPAPGTPADNASPTNR